MYNNWLELILNNLSNKNKNVSIKNNLFLSLYLFYFFYIQLWFYWLCCIKPDEKQILPFEKMISFKKREK
jgi:hypothetical protein